MEEVSNTAKTCPEMFWDCPVFLTQLSQPRDTRDSPKLSQVLVRENTHIPQHLISQDTQHIQDSPRKSYHPRKSRQALSPMVLSILGYPGQSQVVLQAQILRY